MHVPESTALQPKRKRPITFYNLQKLILFEIYFKLGGKNWNARCSRWGTWDL